MTPEELDEALARPTAGAVAALGRTDGDVLVAGAGGKMGPSLARMAQRALRESGSAGQVFAVSRFSTPAGRETARALESSGVRVIACDLLERDAVAALPDVAAVLFLAGTKFGTSADESTTWALNACVPTLVADRYRGVPSVVFSSGNVYPFTAVGDGGATEATPPSPIREYAWSVLARERIFEHFSRTARTPVTIYRLNYATELRYGVPVDIATKVARGEPIDLTMGWFNTIWQGDANAYALCCLDHVASPPRVLNATGPEIVSVRQLALRFGELLETEPVLVGAEAETALLSDAGRALELFGPPTVDLDQLTSWIADWVRRGGPSLDKPTHYDVRDGSF